MTKTCRIPAHHQIVELAPGRGSCIASDRILVDGSPVGYLYQEVPDTDVDSGWRFFSGEESQAYADDPGNFGLYDANTVANYDTEIIPLLDAPVGAAFERDASAIFVLVPSPDDSDAN